jgi:putative tricarboxylic transport membrane protein
VQRSIAAVAFVALGGFTVNYALGLRMYTSEGPGAGLFPLIIGIGLMIAGALWFVQLRTDPEGGEPIVFNSVAMLRVVAQVAALLLFSFLMPQFGFVTAAAVLVVLTAFIAGERSWFWIAVVAALCSVGVQYLFRLLGTQL